jgi:hypothetical protein
MIKNQQIIKIINLNTLIIMINTKQNKIIKIHINIKRKANNLTIIPNSIDIYKVSMVFQINKIITLLMTIGKKLNTNKHLLPKNKSLKNTINNK